MLKTFFNLNNEVIQRRVLVKRLMEDKTLFDISDHKIANVIVKWCGNEENSIEFFLECLSQMGVNVPIRMLQLVKGKEYYIVTIKELETNIMRDLYISKRPKENLKVITIFDSEKVVYNINENKKFLKIEYKSMNLKFFGEDSIRMSVGNNIEIMLKGYEWNKESNLYEKAKELIQDLEKIDKNMEPYEYYSKAKKEIRKYYNLEGVNFEFLMNKFSLITRDGQLVLYDYPANGIIIKKYQQWVYKKYSTNEIELIWEDKLKCDKELPDQEIEKYIEMAEKAISKIENLEY